MITPARVTSILLIGFGIGAAAGDSLDSNAVMVGGIAFLVGIGLSFVPSEQPSGVAEPVRDDRPGLADLGTRVEQILRLAQEQADDHRAGAVEAAERTVAVARAEAQAILDRARAEAARLGDPSARD